MTDTTPATPTTTAPASASTPAGATSASGSARTPARTLADPRVEAVLTRLFAAAERDAEVDARAFSALVEGPVPASPQELADAAAEIYMPVSEAGGRLLYNLVRAVRPATVVEFGTSFGISTLHLAAAVRDNGAGRVLTTEMSQDKIAAARAGFAEAGLDDLVTVLAGDARETLAGPRGPADSVDFLLLDGWKDLCLPVLRLLEPRIPPGTLVVADDVDLPDLAPYLAYVRDPANGYQSVTFPVEDGMEISCRL